MFHECFEVIAPDCVLNFILREAFLLRKGLFDIETGGVVPLRLIRGVVEDFLPAVKINIELQVGKDLDFIHFPNSCNLPLFVNFLIDDIRLNDTLSEVYQVGPEFLNFDPKLYERLESIFFKFGVL